MVTTELKSEVAIQRQHGRQPQQPEGRTVVFKERVRPLFVVLRVVGEQSPCGTWVTIHALSMYVYLLVK